MKSVISIFVAGLASLSPLQAQNIPVYLDESALPATMEIDYVRVFQKK